MTHRCCDQSCTVMMLVTLIMVWITLVEAAPAPATIAIGAACPLTGSQAITGQRAFYSIRVALDDILNSTDIFANTAVTLYRNDTTTPVNAALSAGWMVQHGVQAIIGSLLSAQTIPISNIATSTSTPVLAYSVAAPEFSDATLHPYFSRLIVSDSTTGATFLRLMRANGWTKYSILHTAEAYGRGLADWLLQNTPSDITYNAYSFPVTPSLGIPTIKRALRSIEASQSYVILLHAVPGDLVPFFPTLFADVLWKSPYVWVGSSWVHPSTVQGSLVAANISASNFRGMVGIAPEFIQTPKVSAWNQRMRALYPTAFTQSILSNRDVTPYDAMWIIALALKKMWSLPAPNTGALLLQCIRNVTYTGLSGDIAFDPKNNGDMFGAVSLWNFNNTINNFAPIGRWVNSPDNRVGYLVINQSAIWLDGTTNIPRDQPGYTDGTPLGKVYHGDQMVLSFGIAILGAWTCLIVLEQATAYHRKANVSQKDRWARSRSYIWLALGSIALASCSVWGMALIGQSAVSVDQFAPLFEPTQSLTSLVYALALCFAGLSVQLWALSNGLRGITVNGVQKITAPTPPAVKALVNAITPLRSLKNTLKQITPYTFLSSFLLTAATVGTCLIVQDATNVPAHETTNVGYPIGGVIVCWFMSTIGVVGYFYGETQLWRIAAAFWLASGFFITLQLNVAGYNWHYSTDMAAHIAAEYNHHWTVGTINLLVSITAAVLCFLFIGINVSSLKLSRNVLDRLLAQMQTQMSSLERALAVEKKQVRSANLDADEARRHLELINFCRPFLRNHAIALAMANKAHKHDSMTTTGGNNDAPVITTIGSPTVPNRAGSPPLASTNGNQVVSLLNAEIREGKKQQAAVPLWSLALAVPKSDRDVMALLNELNGPLHLESGPVAERAVSEVKLQQLLGHPVTLEILKDSLLKTMNGESLTLLLDIQRYRTLEKAQTRSAIAQEMYTMFIQPRSVSEVNLSSAMRDKIARAIRAGDPRADVFDEVEAELLRLVNTNSMDAFQSTPQFKLCCLILNHPSYRLQRRRADGDTLGRQSVMGSNQLQDDSEDDGPSRKTNSGLPPPSSMIGGTSPAAIHHINTAAAQAANAAMGGTPKSNGPQIMSNRGGGRVPSIPDGDNRSPSPVRGLPRGSNSSVPQSSPSAVKHHTLPHTSSGAGLTSGGTTATLPTPTNVVLPPPKGANRYAVLTNAGSNGGSSAAPTDRASIASPTAVLVAGSAITTPEPVKPLAPTISATATTASTAITTTNNNNNNGVVPINIVPTPTTSAEASARRPVTGGSHGSNASLNGSTVGGAGTPGTPNVGPAAPTSMPSASPSSAIRTQAVIAPSGAVSLVHMPMDGEA